MVQCCFTSTETIRLIRMDSPGWPPGLSHSSWTMTDFSFHIWLFVASSLNLWGWWLVWSDCHLFRQSIMPDCFHFHCQAGGWHCIGCTAFKDGVRTLLDSEAPPHCPLVTEQSVYIVRSCGLLFLLFLVVSYCIFDLVIFLHMIKIKFLKETELTTKL